MRATGFFAGFLELGFPLGLHGLKLGGVLLDGALKAMGVDSDLLQTRGGVYPSDSLRGGRVQFAGLFLFDSEKQSVFHFSCAAKAPPIAGDPVDDVLFEWAYGGERFAELESELIEGRLLAGEGGVAAPCQPVNERVSADGIFSGLRDWAGGFFVRAVGFEAAWSHHGGVFPLRSS